MARLKHAHRALKEQTHEANLKTECKSCQCFRDQIPDTWTKEPFHIQQKPSIARA